MCRNIVSVLGYAAVSARPVKFCTPFAVTNTKISLIKINSVTETNDSCSENHHTVKCLCLVSNCLGKAMV